MRRILIAITSLVLLQSLAGAQSNSGTITGSLSDSMSKQPLAFATVSVYRMSDSSLATYRMTSPEGHFKVTSLPLATSLKLVISFSGYRVYKKELFLSNDKPEESLGNISLSPDTRSLDEVLVYSERPPVVMKNDTIEFNASSFKTLPASLVEDLLKKLPGLEVDRNGNILANGKPVSRIMVDGKDFFGGDPKVATRNLPANIIDKVQVMNDKRQLEANPTMNIDEADQVINLKLKKSIKKGWFGKAYAGSGTNERKEAGAIINSFRDTLQVSTLAYTNNLNRSGFSSNELFQLGGFQRSGVNEMSMTNSGGIAFNGISFGGMGEGILRSSGGGLNMNYSAKKNLDVNFMYFTGTSKSDNTVKENTVQNLKDTLLTGNETRENFQKNINHRFGGKIEWQIDSLSRLFFKPSLVTGTSTSTLNQLSLFSSNKKGDLYSTINNQYGDGNSEKYQHEFSISRQFRKKIPSVRIDNTMSLTSSGNNRLTNAVTDFFTGSLNYVNQLQSRYNYKFLSSTNINLTKFITKKLQVNLSHNSTQLNNTDDLNVYELDGTTGKYEVYNPLLSNRVTRTGMKNKTTLYIHHKGKKITLYGSAGLLSMVLNNKFDEYAPVNQRYRFLLPTAGMIIKKTGIFYAASVTEPVAADLQPVIDNSNPVFQVLGNPELRPTVTQSVTISRNTYDRNKLLSVYLYLYGAVQNRAVIRERWIDADGVQITRPINKDGVWNFYQQLSINKQYKFNKGKSFSWYLGTNAGYTITYTKVNQVISGMNTVSFTPALRIGYNWNDKVEVSQLANYSWNRSSYAVKHLQPVMVKSFYYTADVIVRLPKKIVWESNMEFSRYSDVTPGFRQSSLRWNIAVNYQFLIEDKGNLKLSVFDLLKQNAGISRNVSENFIRDTERSVLTRYFLLTFTYNIRDFKAKKIGGKDAILWF